jgi:hypothetical protein
MAYLREANQELEVDFSLESIWEAIPKAVAGLDWEIKEKDENTHQLTIGAIGSFASYGSTLKVKLTKIDNKTTHIDIEGETPVTTITSTLDFGQTDERVDRFILALARIMNSDETNEQ